MIKVKSKKIIAILLLVLTLFSTLSSTVFATEISSVNLVKGAECGLHLQYWNNDKNGWYYVTCTYVTYNKDGKEYPAYCLNRELPGVGEHEGYTVNIDSVIDNVEIWRTITRGYPYRTPAEMGVENKYDAFIATKQAVYCILYGEDPTTKYRGEDARGIQITNAIINLVNEGRYGTRTPSDGTINISTLGNLYEEGNYYVQKFNVNSDVDIASYTITATTNMPVGGIITNTSGTQTNNFNGKESFLVKIPKASMVSDINTVINVQGKCKTYPVFYGKTTVAGTQDYAVTYDPFGDGVGRATLNVKTNTGKVSVIKKDDETKQPIEGVTFKLMKEDGTVVGNATTGKDGIATFSKLYQGKYKLVETDTNSKYILNVKEFDVDVEYNKTTEITVENEHKKGDIKVYKVDKDNNKVVLGNVEFQLYSHEFGKVIGTYYTDVNGILEIKDVRIGDYSLIETKTNKWYNLAEDTEIEVNWDLTTETTIENELKKGAIKIIKVDEEDNEIKLENVKFNVMDEGGKVLEQLTTDENGEATTSRYPIRDFEKLQIQEVETLDNYVLNDEIITITLEENQIKDMVFENEKIKGQIKVIKVSADDNELTEEKKGTPIEGATFNVLDSEGNIVDTLITKEDGTAISKELLKGNYTVVEIDSGSPYYLVNSEEFKVEIKEHKKIVDVTVEDESVDIDIEVNKTGFKETQSKDTIYYDFSNIINKSNVALDDFTWKDTLPTNALTANRIYTGTWNEELTYSVWYKTNLSDDYIMLVDNLSTTVNNEVKFTDINLKEGEFITEFEFRFGTVKSGFREIEKPRLYCDMKEGLGNGFVFTNHTMVSGTYFDKYVEDKDDWTTITYYKEIEITQKLPRTGC